MIKIDGQGMVLASQVRHQRFPFIEHGSLSTVSAIVIHQTDTDTTQAVLASYASGGNGAHFLVERSGQIIQTASIQSRCFHVGRLIKSRCLEIRGAACKDPAIAATLTLGWRARINALDAVERSKSYPDRYPVNSDSIGIELVGKHLNDSDFDPLTGPQRYSLQWLVAELTGHLRLSRQDVFRHPEISYKHPGEAASATW